MREQPPSTDRAPACPGPDPHPHRPTRFVVPQGAVDTHAHVIAAPPAHPLVSGRSYTPPPATPESYLAMLDATGMSHGVLVQVSVHGTDNSLMVETLTANRDRLRGIAVIPLGLPDRELAALKAAGVVGLRLNVLYGGGVGFDQLDQYAALAREMGWHLQFLVDAKDLPDLSPRLGKLPVPFVVDHWGHFPTSRGIADPGFQALVSLVRDGAWVKLSGAYRNSVGGPPYADTVPFARLLHEAAPERCVWGSDWPHVAHWQHMMNVGDLLDLLADWVPDPVARARVLTDNAHRLYGFAPAGLTTASSPPAATEPGRQPS
ncbi:Predicted metal-dependent hydrolase, TIM-barrel fold [Bosea lupini]|uniref:Predicted metal-dependent hydrolase, TIM-barrel fold n=1 Tax=Bosea lupini TaxID=1036779 RepID=A0A1H7IG26_9HYPH|nr:amidohydrolase family protein [Bosea lupini]SEK61513.1 Predicted metal-dependent hydrolase, TIM-barrel fold [Bosea lupini]